MFGSFSLLHFSFKRQSIIFHFPLFLVGDLFVKVLIRPGDVLNLNPGKWTENLLP